MVLASGRVWVVSVLVAVTLSGCGVLQCKLCAKKFGEEDDLQAGHVVQQQNQNGEFVVRDPVVISVTGYEAPDSQVSNAVQRRLMAMRASEVDAYRRLAERVRGVQVSSNTKVMDFITSYDDMRSIVDSYVRNAKISFQGFTKEGYYETTLLLTLDNAFFNQLLVSQGEGIGITLNDGGAKSRVSATLSSDTKHYDFGFGVGFGVHKNQVVK